MNYGANLILTSENIFSGLENESFNGYIAIKDDRIIKIAKGSIPEDLINEETKIIDLKEKTILPGFIDVHCFFTGYVIRFLGIDLSKCKSLEEIQTALENHQ